MSRSYLKRSIVAVAALTACLVPATLAHAALRVTELLPQTSAGTASTINGDWWELTNTGPAAINLSGYQWADTEDALAGSTPQANRFPSVTINVNESIVILEEASSNEAAWRTNWSAPLSLVILGTDEMLPSLTPVGTTDTFSGLGSSDDGVFFYSPAGTLLSSYTYTTTTRGVSFEAGNDGANLGLSVAGQNNALSAANGDLGSPGAAVPEPGSLSLLGGIGATALTRRPRQRARVG